MASLRSILCIVSLLYFMYFNVGLSVETIYVFFLGWAKLTALNPVPFRALIDDIHTLIVKKDSLDE